MSNIEQEGIASGKQHCDKSEILTIPNVISFLRIVFIAPFVLFFLNEQYIAAFSFIVLSGLSDCIDGYLARRLNQVTELGKILDPIADKLKSIAADKAKLADYAKLLYAQARLISGLQIENPAEISELICELM